MSPLNPIEKIHNPFTGTIYEEGYGFALSYVANSRTLSMDAKRVYASYSLFMHSDGSGVCTASLSTLLNDYCRMKKVDFYGGRGELTACGLLLSQNQFKKREGSEASNRDCTEVRFNMRPEGFVPSRDGGIDRDSAFAFPKGMWPRRICLDRGLSKKAVVAAYYICANKGTIDEYLLSGHKMRQNLHTDGKPMSKYSFDTVLKELAPYFDIVKLAREEVSAFYTRKGKTIRGSELSTDYYRIRLIDGFGKEDDKPSENIHSVTGNIYSGGDFGTSKKGTFEKGTDENGTLEKGTHIKNISLKTVCFDNLSVPDNSSDHQHAESFEGHADDERTGEDSVSFKSGRGECPMELRERLGEEAARKEINCLYEVLGQIDGKTRAERLDRLGRISDALYRTALEDPSLEEYALAMNASYLISHRMMEISRVTNLGQYVRSILKNAKQDLGFVEAPVKELSGYRAVVDGYRLSDGGRSRRPFYAEAGNTEPAATKDISFYRETLADWIRRFGYEKDGCTYVTDAPLPEEFTKDKAGRRMLARILYSFFRQSAYETLDNAYDDLDEAILKVQKAIMELFGEKDFYLNDDTFIDRHHLSKQMQSLIFLDGRGELCVKRNLYEKAVALYLRANSTDGVFQPDKWLKTVLVNELRFCLAGDTSEREVDVLNPVPAFRETAEKRDREILRTALSDRKPGRGRKAERKMEVIEDGEGRFYGKWVDGEGPGQDEKLEQIREMMRGVADGFRF